MDWLGRWHGTRSSLWLVAKQGQYNFASRVLLMTRNIKRAAGWYELNWQTARCTINSKHGYCLGTWCGGQIGYTFYWSKAMCLMHQYQADTGGARQPIWLTDYAPLCLRHMYVLTAPFVWRIILYFSTVLQTHIVAWLPYLVDGLYFTLSQTHVLTAQGKTAQTMGLVSRCPPLHLDWWCNHKAWKIQMDGIYLIIALLKVFPS